MRDPADARTPSSVSRTPERVALLVIRTTGNGCISVSGAAPTGIVWVDTADTPLASVTRSWTTWLPCVEKVVLIPEPPVANAPVPATSQANEMIGLPASVELETSDTLSPTRGAVGNQENEATGAPG